jgi:hypothetical protein
MLSAIQQDTFVPAAEGEAEASSNILGYVQLGRNLKRLKLPNGYAFIIHRAALLSPDEAQANRARFTRYHKQMFRDHVARRLDVQVASLIGYDIHHRVPVCIGGSNAFSNLALIKPEYHTPLHRDVIDPQTWGAMAGKTQDFILPVPTFGGPVWGDRPPSNRRLRQAELQATQITNE